jgi:hypothetical protein
MRKQCNEATIIQKAKERNIRGKKKKKGSESERR